MTVDFNDYFWVSINVKVVKLTETNRPTHICVVLWGIRMVSLHLPETKLLGLGENGDAIRLI